MQKRNQHYRQRQLISRCANNIIEINNKQCINFSSNDYLGMAQHPLVVAAFKRCAEEFGVGSSASQFISGFYGPHRELELKMAEFLGLPKAVLFNSGYMANLGVISALTNRSDLIIQDKRNHASLIDAGLLSRAKVYRCRELAVHGDADVRLTAATTNSSAQQIWLVSDGVFSMRGDIANLPAMSKLASKHQATILLDDAHALGVIGNGRGTVAHYRQQGAMEAMNSNIIQICPLGKAIGCAGAIVAGSQQYIEQITQAARTLMYTTNVPPAVAAAALKSLELLQTETWRQEQLLSLIKFFSGTAQQYQIPMLPSATAIQCIPMFSCAAALKISQQLQAAGFYVVAIRPPTVACEADSLLRIVLNVNHSEQQIMQLLITLGELL